MKRIFVFAPVLLIGTALLAFAALLLCVAAFNFYPSPLLCKVGYGCYLAVCLVLFREFITPFALRKNLLEILVLVLLATIVYMVWQSVPYGKEMVVFIACALWYGFGTFMLTASVFDGLDEVRTGNLSQRTSYWIALVAGAACIVMVPIMAGTFSEGFGSGILLAVVPQILLAYTAVFEDFEPECECGLAHA